MDFHIKGPSWRNRSRSFSAATFLIHPPRMRSFLPSSWSLVSTFVSRMHSTTSIVEAPSQTRTGEQAEQSLSVGRPEQEETKGVSGKKKRRQRSAKSCAECRKAKIKVFDSFQRRMTRYSCTDGFCVECSPEDRPNPCRSECEGVRAQSPFSRY